MSEIVLDAILRLFAVVARQDELNRQEREQIRQFLLDHVNEARVESYLARFVAYSDERKSADLQEEKEVRATHLSVARGRDNTAAETDYSG